MKEYFLEWGVIGLMDKDEDGYHYITDELLDLVEHNPYLYPRLHACI